MKNNILGFLSGISFLLIILSSFVIYVAGFTFLILLSAKIFGVQGIEWFSFLHLSVIMTPIYMFVGGIISAIVNYILMRVFITLMDE